MYDKKRGLAAVAFAACVVFLAYLPLVRGKVAAPLNILSGCCTWSYMPNSAKPDNSMGDVVTAILPYRIYTLNQIKRHNIPLWSDLNFGGSAYLANVQSSVFNPLNALIFITDPLTVQNLIVVSQSLLAIIFMYLMLSGFDLRPYPAIFGSLAFAFSSYMVVWAEWGTIGSVFMWCPLLIYLAHRIIRRDEEGWLLPLFSVIYAVQFFEGHFEFSLILSLVVVSFVILDVLIMSSRASLKQLLLLAAAAGVGLLIAAIQILPTIAASSGGYRTNIPIKGMTGSFVSVNEEIIKLISPNYFGNPIAHTYRGSINYLETASYVGVEPVLFLLVSLLFARKSRSKSIYIFAVVWMVLSLLLAAGKFPFSLFWLLIPPLRKLAAARFMIVFAFSASILAACGFDALLDFAYKTKKNGIRFAPLVFITFGALLSVLGAILIVRRSGLLSVRSLSDIYYSSHWLPLILGVGAGLLSIGLMLLGGRRMTQLGVVISILYIAASGITYSLWFLPFSSKAELAIGSPLMKKVDELSGHSRLFRISGLDGFDANILYNLPSIDGYDSLHAKIINEVITGINKPNSTPIENPIVINNYSKPGSLDALGVRYVLTRQDLHEGFLRLVSQDSGWNLYENVDSPVLMHLTSQVINESLAAQLHSITTGSIPFDGVAEQGVSGLSGNSGKVRVESWTPGDINLSTYADGRQLLFTGLSRASGWSAYVDGAPVQVIASNYYSWSVPVDRGVHDIRLIYMPFSYRLGSTLAIMGLVLLLAFCLRPIAKQFRPLVL